MKKSSLLEITYNRITLRYTQGIIPIDRAPVPHPSLKNIFKNKFSYVR